MLGQLLNTAFSDAPFTIQSVYPYPVSLNSQSKTPTMVQDKRKQRLRPFQALHFPREEENLEGKNSDHGPSFGGIWG